MVRVFTGLVQELGTVEELEDVGGGVRLTVAASLTEDLAEGGSVAVNGVCLTATAVRDHRFQAEVMNETRARTSLSEVSPGTGVNLVKGSITVDGVSLTVADVDERSFTVSLIPETLERTNLGAAEAGARVNLEVDILAKYVEKLVRR